MDMTTPRRKFAPRVKLVPNLRKILESIGYVVGEAEKRRIAVTQYDILKTLFLADKAHLNEYGRPITYDNYCAMRNGPVPSLAYDLLKETPSTLDQVKRARCKLLWKRSPEPERGSGRYYYSQGVKVPDFDVLSESDVSALSGALTTVKTLPFPELRKILHSDEAYLEAWEADSSRKSFPMSYGMMFSVPNFEAAERIEFFSKMK